MEVGSEFYTASTPMGYNQYLRLSPFPMRYVLSGRTALSLISEEIIASKKTVLNNISLPNYCCGSMVAPFIHHGFRISFYNMMDLKRVCLDDLAENVLLMDYFGFLSDDTVSFAKRCKAAGKILIVDATQTAFSHSETYEIADYMIVSYRKWADCLCASVYSKKGFFAEEYTLQNSAYHSLWRKAASLKQQYIFHGVGEKQSFLSMYAQANKLLEEQYMGCKTDAFEIECFEAIDSISLREKRRANAQVLLDQLDFVSEKYNIKLLYSKIREEDCPLFVPILVEPHKRTFIRSNLSNAGIYCPAHWPINTTYPSEEMSYHREEISLICDQRYTAEDMYAQLDSLHTALELSI